MKLGKTMSELNVGDKTSLEMVITAEQIELFAKATGDFNPLHINEDYAKTTQFKQRIAHGILLSGIVSGLLGMNLPGLGTIAREMTSKFMRPVFIGDKITATAEVTEKNEKLNLVTLKFVVKNQNNKAVGKGKAVVIPRQ